MPDNDITATNAQGQKVRLVNGKWVGDPASFLQRLRNAAWTKPGDIAAEKPVMDSGENPALGNVPGSTSGKYPIQEGMGEAGSLANAGMIIQGILGKGSPMGMPERIPSVVKVAKPATEAVKGAAKSTVEGAKVAGREIAGRGPSMERLQAAQDLNAQPLKTSLKSLSNNVRTDASRLLDASVKAMDKAQPQGIASKADFGPKVNEILKSNVKIESDKTPSPLPEMAESPESDLSQASVFKGGGQALRGSGVSDALRSSQLTAAGRQRLNDFLSQIGESPVQEQKPGDGISAAELQQLRSKLYDAAYGAKAPSLSGWMRNAARDVYSLATKTLDKSAEQAGGRTSEAWKTGNAKWKTFKEVFNGTYENGKFNESPISKSLSGRTADEIVGPLSKGNWMDTKKLLNQYEGKFGGNLDQVSKIVSRHEYLKGLESNPAAYFYAMAASGALSPALGLPAYGMSTYGFYRILTPMLRRLLATRGIDPKAVLKGYEPIEPGLPKAGLPKGGQ